MLISSCGWVVQSIVWYGHEVFINKKEYVLDAKLLFNFPMAGKQIIYLIPT